MFRRGLAPIPELLQLAHGELSLGAPIENDVLQLGLAVVDDLPKTRLHVVIGPSIIVAREDEVPLQLEAHVGTGQWEDGKETVKRHLVLDEPIGRMTLRPLWGTRARWGIEEVNLTSQNREGLEEFAKLIGQHSLWKQRREAWRQRHGL